MVLISDTLCHLTVTRISKTKHLKTRGTQDFRIVFGKKSHCLERVSELLASWSFNYLGFKNLAKVNNNEGHSDP